MKILIVEDERPIANLIHMNLTACGYQCTSVHDGLEAADLLETECYDLILLYHTPLPRTRKKPPDRPEAFVLQVIRFWPRFYPHLCKCSDRVPRRGRWTGDRRCCFGR